ncbi:VOC family protein [Sabulilitoribacter multivorans]|uniref:VOC family protein n=1 Tax=Flaviramulus multivorans TaxID=1304750 RepID=A0ABS9IG81_9FLAO|nr:VOC family protein [Flaviramulus multivorans]MCF7559764.1 VOC family protein [Flaviramulus multivorans]
MKKIILFVTIALLSKSTFAQDNSDFSMSFDHLALSVKDVDISAEFYKSIFNLNEITNKGKTDGVRWFSLGDGKELHLISIVEGDIKLNKAVHFAVTTSSFDAFIQTLTSKNIGYTSWTGEDNKITLRDDGVQQVYVQDPDGYWVEVNSVMQKK